MAEVGGELEGANRVPKSPTDRVSEWIRLLRAVRALCESLEAALSPFGLMVRDYELLRCLPGRALSQSAIVRQLDTSEVSVSRGVRRLSAQGWVSLSVANADKRVSWVALTDAGAERLDQTEAHVGQFLAVLTAGLDDEEWRLLGQINEALQRFRHGPGADGVMAEKG